MVSALSAMPGPELRGDTEVAGEAGAQRGADAGDLVLGLERGDAEALVLAQLVQHVGGRGDRVGAEEQRQVGLAGGGDQAQRQRGVAVDLAVAARRHGGRGHLVADGEHLGRLAEGVTGLEGGDVGVADVGLAGELAGQEGQRALGRAVVQPRQQAEREHVLGPGGVLAAQPEGLDGLDGHARQVQRVHLEVGEAVVLERVRRVADLGQVALGEVRGVGDDDAPARQVGDVGLERRGVHGDEHVRPVARGHDVVVGEVQLEAGDAGQGAGWRPDLGREVRQRRDVVAEDGGVGGEPVAGQLHPVPGVPGEPDDDAVEGVDLLHSYVPFCGGRGRDGPAGPARGREARGMVRSRRCRRMLVRAARGTVPQRSMIRRP